MAYLSPNKCLILSRCMVAGFMVEALLYQATSFSSSLESSLETWAYACAGRLSRVSFSESDDNSILSWISSNYSVASDQLSSWRQFVYDYVYRNMMRQVASDPGAWSGIIFNIYCDDYLHDAAVFASGYVEPGGSGGGGGSSSWNSTAITDLTAAISALAVPIYASDLEDLGGW